MLGAGFLSLGRLCGTNDRFPGLGGGGGGTDTIVGALLDGVGGSGKSNLNPPSGKAGIERSEVLLCIDQFPNDATDADAVDKIAERKSGLEFRLGFLFNPGLRLEPDCRCRLWNDCFDCLDCLDSRPERW